MSENNTQFYDVLVNMSNYWISENDLIKILDVIPMKKLGNFVITKDYNLIKYELYYKVGLDLLVFIKKNTNNPKLCPQFVSLKDKKNENKQDANKGRAR